MRNKEVQTRRSWGLALGVCLALLGSQAANAEDKKPSRHLVAMYQVAAGKHLDFLKWMAAREAVAREAGASDTMWFMHQNGASWDFIAITPEPDAAKQAEVDKKIDAISKQRGLSIGVRASLEFRQYMGTHSDTYALGPMTADELVKAAEKKD